MQDTTAGIENLLWVRRAVLRFPTALSRLSSLSLVSLLSLALVSCGGRTIKHEYEVAPGRMHDPASTTKALLIPLNEIVDIPTGLEPGRAETTRLIVQFLESKGLAVETLDRPDFRRAMSQAASQVRDAQLSGATNSVSESVDFADFVPALLAQLDSDADLVISPNFSIRTGEYTSGKLVRWDGVVRRERGAGVGGMTGNTSVASLFTLIYDRKGERLLAGYGGLDLIFELSLSEKKYVLREDRLQDIENLQEGICISMHPFFGLEERC